ncbi:hypothetical protein NP233_g5198 [Leucocoprinus birnbaumii]|uniref:CNH domain-containing protein n=1 Tax=Leucocoprinus birnbaumii TaxID=56174 RepID=A0AAD5YR60_9AGAR|nr:hypothetical protein NP233_g5198 [Leucocoprinus birnbaumii]
MQPNSPLATVDPQCLNPGDREVQFFTVGMMHNRTLIIYMTKGEGNDSEFHAIEPVAGNIGRRPTANSSISWRWHKNKISWFRQYRDFIIPSECYDLIFLEARIAILCQKGLSSVTIPVTQDSRLAQRCESCRPLGMFRINEEEFLLCYSEFGLYINRHGDPSRVNCTIEWEGAANAVALNMPYIVLFNSQFIEFRHTDDGHLAQIIIGDDIRCSWDGRCYGWPETNDAIYRQLGIQVVMNSSQLGGNPDSTVSQHVFELVPAEHH